MKKQPLSRNDYLSIIGFFGNAAIISKNRLARVKKLSFEQLLQKGMIRESICDAIYDNAEEKKRKICQKEHEESHASQDGSQGGSQDGASSSEGERDDASYAKQFQALVREYGVLEDILQLEITKKYI